MKTKHTLNYLVAFILVCLAHSYAQAAGAKAQDQQPTKHPAVEVFLNPISDPLEGMNRSMESFNSVMVRYVVYPLGYTYNLLVPACIQDGISNVGHNLIYPLRLITNLLQGKGADAWEETARFGINTTVGILGWNDQAKDWGFQRHDEDFGQTLATWGVGSGCYLNLPFIGPSNVRDTLTLIPDMLLTPHTYVPGVGAVLAGNSLFANAAFLNNYFESHDATYATTKAAYTLGRENLIKDSIFKNRPMTPPDQSLGVLKLIPKQRSFFTLRKERKVTMPTGRKPIPYSLYTHRKPDGRLIFIIPGLFSTRDNSDMMALAELFYRQGWTVAVISSTFTPEFFTATDMPLPGFLPKDCENLDTLLTLIKDQIFSVSYKKFPKLKPQVTVFGVSLGAINTLYLAARDYHGKSTLRAQRFIAVNPPRDPLAALIKLDRCFDLPLQWKPESEQVSRVREAIQKITGTILFSESCPDPQLDFEESRFLIGLNCRLGLMELIKAVEQANQDASESLDGICPKVPLQPVIHTQEVETLEADAFALSLQNYLKDILMPFARQQKMVPEKASPEEIGAMVRIDSIAPQLMPNPKVRLFHTKNDFLVEPEDLLWYQNILPQRCFIFPQGGHLGQLIDPRAQQAILKAAQ